MEFINAGIKKHHVELKLKDIYTDLMRNQKLDYENFYGKEVVQQCIDEKREMTQKLSKYKS